MIARLSEVSVLFGRKRAVACLSATFDVGVTAVLEPNGAGKTTTLGLLSTRAQPTTGSVQILGHDTSGSGVRAARREIGFLPQHFAYPKHFTALDFVRYHLWLRNFSTDATTSPARDALAALKLEPQLNKRLGQLSGGMLRRVGIAAATAGAPKLILLDEPTVGLDPEQRVSFREYLQALGENSAVLLSTHLADDAERAAERIVVMHEGAVIFDGATHALQTIAARPDGDPHTVEDGYTHVMRQARMGNAA